MKILQTSNIALSAIQPWRRDDFAEKLTGEQAVSATASYLDQDFTVGRLIETDD